MRAITIRPPWAQAIMHYGKNVENRSRNVAGSWRGTLAIHVSTTGIENAGYRAISRITGRAADSDKLHAGHILGVVDLVGVHRAGQIEYCTFDMPCSPWAEPGTVHLELRNPRPLDFPFYAVGRLGLWELPDATILPRYAAQGVDITGGRNG